MRLMMQLPKDFAKCETESWRETSLFGVATFFMLIMLTNCSGVLAFSYYYQLCIFAKLQIKYRKIATESKFDLVMKEIY